MIAAKPDPGRHCGQPLYVLLGDVNLILEGTGVTGILDVAADGAAIDPVTGQHNANRLQRFDGGKADL
jgi:hypothetical protein